MSENSIDPVSIDVLDQDTLAEAVAKARDVDREEALYQTGKPIEDALWNTYSMSTNAYAGRWKGDLVTIWGVADIAPLEGIGQPWLVATDEIYSVRVPFLYNCCYYLNELKQNYDHLFNVVWEENKTAVQWLGWLGFELQEATPIGPYQKQFIRFEWSKNV